MRGSSGAVSTALKLIPLLASVLLLALLFKRIGLEKLISALSRARLSTLLVALGIDIPFVLLKSCKWLRTGRLGMRELKFKEAVSSFLIGVGASLLTPTQLGELARAVPFKGERKEAFILAFIDKLIDLSGLLFLFVISALIWRPVIGIPMGLMWLMGACVGLWILRSKASPVFLISQFVISLACFLLLSFQFYAILLNFGEIRFADAFIGMPVVILSGMAPLTVGGLGLREMTASVVLPRFGIGGAESAASSLLLFAVNGLAIGIPGVILGWSLIIRALGEKGGGDEADTGAIVQMASE